MKVAAMMMAGGTKNKTERLDFLVNLIGRLWHICRTKEMGVWIC